MYTRNIILSDYTALFAYNNNNIIVAHRLVSTAQLKRRTPKQ